LFVAVLGIVLAGVLNLVIFFRHKITRTKPI
jgi:hypothetical protein